MSKILLSLAHMSGHESEYIESAFATNWVVPLGPNVDGFESDLQSYLSQEKSVVALSSGTAALHLALVDLGIERGDEVICQSFTFIASANPILYQGATPVFVDSEADTWNMDPELLEIAIKDRIEKRGVAPKAIVVVDLYGMPAKMDEIAQVAQRYNIPIVEDSAEALGSSYKGQRCGTFGEYGVLSFNGNKIITTSGGGALVCPTAKAAQRAMFFSTQARENEAHYQHEKMGYNYRMSNICAGIGRGQMRGLDGFVERRRRIHEIYTEAFKNVEGIEVQQNPSADFDSNFWLTCILIDPTVCGLTPEDIRLHLVAHNIESRPLWKPMHLQPLFKRSPRYENGTSETLFTNGLCLPSGAALSDEDIRVVIDKILSVIKK